VTKSNLLMQGGVGSAGLTTFIGDLYDSYAVRLTTRFPIRRLMRIEPRLFATYRKHNQGGADLLTLRPTLRVGIRRWQFSLDTEFGVDWFSYFGALSPADELGFHAEVVLRYDF